MSMTVGESFRSCFSWFTFSSNIFEDVSVWARHSVSCMAQWAFLSIALNEMGSLGLNDYNSPRRRRRLGAHHNANDSRNENQTRQEDHPWDHLHSARSRFVSRSVDDDDHVEKHSYSDVVQLRIISAGALSRDKCKRIKNKLLSLGGYLHWIFVRFLQKLYNVSPPQSFA